MPGRILLGEWRPMARLAVVLLVCAGGSMVHVESACATPATVLRAKFTELRDKLENNQFEKPLYLDSSENAGESKGNLYALIQKPFPMVQSALKEPAHWCDILILHLNTKYCRASAEGAWTVLKVNIGKKSEQSIAQSYRMEFSYRVIAATPDHLAVVLDADQRAVRYPQLFHPARGRSAEWRTDFHPSGVFLRLRHRRKAGDSRLSGHGRKQESRALP